MKALVKYGMGDEQVEVREVDDARAERGRVLIEIDAVGVCGSDVHIWRNHQSWPIKLPLVLGHEMAGRVINTGHVGGLSLGQRVVTETAQSVCGHCSHCLSGRYNLCPYRRGYGAMADGAFSRYVLARPQIVHHIPPQVSSAHAALTEPACVAYNALVGRVRVTPGDVVVIQGSGAIGIMATQMARIAGAGAIVVIGTSIDAIRLRVAEAVGATHTVNRDTADPAEVVGNLGDGFGADLVVDCTGVSAALRQALDLVRPMGTIAKIGWGPQPLDFSLDPLVAKAITLAGAFSHTHQTWERALALVATSALILDPVIGGSYDLSHWRDAFQLKQDGSNVKSVITGFGGNPVAGLSPDDRRP